MKTASFVGLISSALLIGGCATQPDRYSLYSNTGDQVVSSPRSIPYDNAAVPPAATDSVTTAPRYDTYTYTPSQGSAASSQIMTDADRALAEQVRRRCEPYARDANVAVYSRSGTITLNGTAPSDADRIAIVNAARSTPGVVAVSDQLQVSRPATATAPTGRYDADRVYAPSPTDFFSLHVRGLTDTDRTLGQRILEGLRADTVLPTIMPVVNIEVADGRVTVRGSVQSEEQKRTILSAIQRAAGVNNVYDELQVTGLPR